MSRLIKVYLGPWNAPTSSWTCDLVGIGGTNVVALFASKRAAANDFEIVGETVRWIGAAPPGEPDQAFLQATLPERWPIALVVAVLGLVGSLAGNAVQAIKVFRDECPANLENENASLNQCRSDKTQCSNAIGEIASLCTTVPP